MATIISGNRVRTGAELDERVSLVAGALLESGVERGDAIAVLLRNDFPYLEVSLGAARVGVVCVPINWHASDDEIGFILTDSSARMIFAHADLVTRVRSVIPAACRIIEIETPPEIQLAYKVTHEEARVSLTSESYETLCGRSKAYRGPVFPPVRRISYTSGTTGRPKGVVREPAPPEVASHINQLALKAHGLDLHPIRAVMPGPLYHSAPNIYALNCVRHGELLVLQPRFDALELLQLMERHDISHMHAVPTMFSRLLRLPEERRNGFDASSLRAIVHGAATCPVELKHRMIDWWGPVILEYYAATEVGIITWCNSEEWLRHPGTVGRAPQGITVAIIGEDGALQPPMEVGDVMFKTDIGKYVHYHGRPDATAELKRDDWLTLGDVGYQDEEGYLWLTDRKTDMIISGGVNIFPAEVERELQGMPGVIDCVAFGMPDDDLGEVVAAVVKADPALFRQDDAMELLIRRLGRMKAPRKILLIDDFPRSDTGKVSRRRVKAEYLDALGQA